MIIYPETYVTNKGEGWIYAGWWFGTFLFSISYMGFPQYMGCHPNPIDELHHFSRWFFNHQPDILFIRSGINH